MISVDIANDGAMASSHVQHVGMLRPIASTKSCLLSGEFSPNMRLLV